MGVARGGPALGRSVLANQFTARLQPDLMVVGTDGELELLLGSKKPRGTAERNQPPSKKFSSAVQSPTGSNPTGAPLLASNQICVTSVGTWLENAPIHNEGETRRPRGREVPQ